MTEEEKHEYDLIVAALADAKSENTKLRKALIEQSAQAERFWARIRSLEQQLDAKTVTSLTTPLT